MAFQDKLILAGIILIFLGFINQAIIKQHSEKFKKN